MRTIKQQQIIDAGKNLFFKHGIKRITVKEISHVAGVSKVTFYKYFENKQALIQVIKNELTETGFAKFDEINKLDLPFAQKIDLMGRWRIEFLESIKGEFVDEVLAKGEFEEKFMERYIQNIVTAQKNGEIRENISPELIALVTEKIREVTLEGKWRKIFDDYISYQDQLRTLIFWGMLTDKNRDKGEK